MLQNLSLVRNAVAISIYFVFSIGLTFYQRWVLQRVPYPISVTSVHLIVVLIMAVITKRLQRSSFRFSDSINNIKIIAPIGIASGIDIAFSNWGLHLVTITLYTLTKSTTIIFILMFAIALKLERKSIQLFSTVTLMALGLFLFTYKSTQFNATGFACLMLASLFSGIRWSFMQLLLQKPQFKTISNPIQMLMYIQPFMIITEIVLAVVIERFRFIEAILPVNDAQHSVQVQSIVIVLFGGLLAFLLAISEIVVVQNTSSLTLSIAGIFKEIIMILLAVEFNGDQLTYFNSIGLLICLLGILSHVLYKMYHEQRQRSHIDPEPTDDGTFSTTVAFRTDNGDDDIPLLDNFGPTINWSHSDNENNQTDDEVLFNAYPVS